MVQKIDYRQEIIVDRIPGFTGEGEQPKLMYVFGNGEIRHMLVETGGPKNRFYKATLYRLTNEEKEDKKGNRTEENFEDTMELLERGEYEAIRNRFYPENPAFDVHTVMVKHVSANKNGKKQIQWREVFKLKHMETHEKAMKVIYDWTQNESVIGFFHTFLWELMKKDINKNFMNATEEDYLEFIQQFEENDYSKTYAQHLNQIRNFCFGVSDGEGGFINPQRPEFDAEKFSTAIKREKRENLKPLSAEVERANLLEIHLKNEISEKFDQKEAEKKKTRFEQRIRALHKAKRNLVIFYLTRYEGLETQQIVELKLSNRVNPNEHDFVYYTGQKRMKVTNKVGNSSFYSMNPITIEAIEDYLNEYDHGHENLIAIYADKENKYVPAATDIARRVFKHKAIGKDFEITANQVRNLCIKEFVENSDGPLESLAEEFRTSFYSVSHFKQETKIS